MQLAASALSIHRSFFFSLFPKQYNRTTICILIVLGIVSNVEMI